jgi:hypothetical protein
MEITAFEMRAGENLDQIELPIVYNSFVVSMLDIEALSRVRGALICFDDDNLHHHTQI